MVKCIIAAHQHHSAAAVADQQVFTINAGVRGQEAGIVSIVDYALLQSQLGACRRTGNVDAPIGVFDNGIREAVALAGGRKAEARIASGEAAVGIVQAIACKYHPCAIVFVALNNEGTFNQEGRIRMHEYLAALTDRERGLLIYGNSTFNDIREVIHPGLIRGNAVVPEKMSVSAIGIQLHQLLVAIIIDLDAVCNVERPERRTGGSADRHKDIGAIMCRNIEAGHLWSRRPVNIDMEGRSKPACQAHGREVNALLITVEKLKGLSNGASGHENGIKMKCVCRRNEQGVLTECKTLLLTSWQKGKENTK